LAGADFEKAPGTGDGAIVVVSTGTVVVGAADVVVGAFVVVGAAVVVVVVGAIVVVGVVEPEPESTNSKTLGEPTSADVTRFGVAEATSALRTCVGERPPLAPRRRAAAPATCGEAIDVPLIVFVAVDEVYQADLMLDPGAKMSRQLPKFE
jgi:hypothetical protein